jgi:hypothetical protein
MVRLKGLLSSFVLNNRLPCLATSRFLPVRNGEVRVGASRLAAHTSPSSTSGQPGKSHVNLPCAVADVYHDGDNVVLAARRIIGDGAVKQRFAASFCLSKPAKQARSGNATIASAQDLYARASKRQASILHVGRARRTFMRAVLYGRFEARRGRDARSPAPAAGLNWEVELITLAYDRRTVGHLPVWSELCFDSVIVLKWERTRAKAKADSR